MRVHNPIQNTGAIVNRETGDFMGNCVVFRYPGRFLTAAHLVRDVPPDQLGLVLPSRAPDRVYHVSAVALHPAADVAALTVPGVGEDDVTWPHYEVWDDRMLGVEFMAFGYPVDWSDAGL